MFVDHCCIIKKFVIKKNKKIVHKYVYPYYTDYKMEKMMKQPFKPQKLVDVKLDLVKLIPLISKSNASLSNYNGALKHLINPDVLLSPMTVKEATLSSKIEGTQATLTEVLKHDAGENFFDEKLKDINEIINYRNAVFLSIKMLKSRPFIHLNMIKELHKTLLSGVRGQNKARGEFRKTQNWIGSFNCTQDTATYIPPAVPDMMLALDDWEKFINSDYIDILIQLGLIHAQFEIIHPFLDGNGRLGRILIPLFLFQKKYLIKPVFYLSEYFEQNRDEYYFRLNNISEKDDWQSWIEFFLTAIIKQSENNSEKVKEVMELYETKKHKIQEITKSQYSQIILDTIFIKPIINSTNFCELTKIGRKATSNAILQKLVEHDVLILLKESAGNKPAMYAFAKLINLTEGREVI